MGERGKPLNLWVIVEGATPKGRGQGSTAR
jgi:hypothetical protein